MVLTDAAIHWFLTSRYALEYDGIDIDLLHSIAEENAKEDGREKVSRNDYEAALAAMNNAP